MYDTDPGAAADRSKAPLVRLMHAEERIELAAAYLRETPVFGGQPPPAFPANYLTRRGRRARRRLFAFRDAVYGVEAARWLARSFSPQSDSRWDRLDKVEILEEAVDRLDHILIPAFRRHHATTPPRRPVPAAEEADTAAEPDALPDAADVTRPNPEGSPA